MTQAAIEAAIDDERHRRPRLTGKRAVATGAALALAARVAIKRGPGLPDVVGLMHVPEHLRERLADRWMPEADRGDEEPDEGPEAEVADDEYDDEDESPDEGGDPESLEDDEAGISNGAPSDRDTPGLLEVLGARRSRPPAMSRRRRSRVRVDPVARPPEPPERASSADE